MYPPTVETNAEFDEYEAMTAPMVEKFDLLMRSIRTNHKLHDGLCFGCRQDNFYLVYSRQVECSKHPFRSSRKSTMKEQTHKHIAFCSKCNTDTMHNYEPQPIPKNDYSAIANGDPVIFVTCDICGEMHEEM